MGIFKSGERVDSGGGNTSLLEALYPVGSLYIGTQDECPLVTLGIGTWTKLNSGRLLQISDASHEANSTIEAGLPNITGAFNCDSKSRGASGAFWLYNTAVVRDSYSSTYDTLTEYHFDASRSSSIYGKSSTVQPPAYVVNVWRRIS